ncbi:hypothetical protein BKA65DRAFT_479313 [Rhexocercosporidium sp. MPI-PUGE-AT-0058]|nr:hypothetical protein BKA65DRAFT_479313 [Rhexocercosporidium sp. MPI-PUGE-AT-0058]
MATADDVRIIEKEVQGVVEAVGNVAGPKSLVVIAIVSKDALTRVQRTVRITTRDNLPDMITAFSRSYPQSRLAIIRSAEFSSSSMKIEIPAVFKSLDIITASGHDLYLTSDSSFCGISLTKWNGRSASHASYELILRTNVYLELPDYEFAEKDVRPHFKFDDEGDVANAAVHIPKDVEDGPPMSVSSKQSDVLPWLAAGAGAAAGAATAVGMVSSFKFSAWGAYVSYGPLTAATGYAAGTGSLAIVGGAALGVGVGVAAAVYFIPWRKLATWAVKAWDLFMVFVKSVWTFFKRAWQLFLGFLRGIIKAIKMFAVGVAGMFSWGVKSVYSSVFGSSSSERGMEKPLQF